MTIADLHTHSTYSPDSVITPEELVNKAGRLGLDIICITDHSIFEQSIGIESFNIKNKKLLVIRGVELATDNGELLIFGLKNDFWKGFIVDMQILPSAEKVISAVNSFNGVAIWAHPFRKHNIMHYNVDYKKFHGVKILETLNGHNDKIENDRAFDYAKEYGFKMIGGSDSHAPGQIGRCLTLFKDNIQTEDEFVSALKTSEYKPITYEEFRGRNLSSFF
ncbi:MAG: PHP domain-containing protein [Proteobacteria bacterium]|nr:PHP domain-containing protein [Pseudomonadota bacterium]